MRSLLSILIVALLLPGFSTNAQERLSLRAAVTQQFTTLGPERLSGLQWVVETDYYSYRSKPDGKALMLASVHGNEKSELVTAAA